MIAEELKWFEIHPYKYPRARSRVDGLVRVCGFLNLKPTAWEFILGSIDRREKLVAVMQDDDGEYRVNVTTAEGRLTNDGHSLLISALPTNVARLLTVVGGRR